MPISYDSQMQTSVIAVTLLRDPSLIYCPRLSGPSRLLKWCRYLPELISELEVLVGLHITVMPQIERIVLHLQEQEGELAKFLIDNLGQTAHPVPGLRRQSRRTVSGALTEAGTEV
ncbi:hypothetical protein BDV40DRAFT_301946 [Aspergillus tamarii]|uniref:Uncharacterized protein n=1 Tax=Aspergillus tamarii TaxID=41984 RepID=A0A5N6UQJ0_ASPTM|nr:hypothetical protein BDV40DRAFT_301946 [Aspergillus tamarii]